MRKFVMLFAVSWMACASSGTREQTIHVVSVPEGAAVEVACGTGSVHAGTTPVDVRVTTTEDCHITLLKPGYAGKIVQLTRVSVGRSANLKPSVVEDAYTKGVSLNRHHDDAYRQVPESINVMLDPLLK